MVRWYPGDLVTALERRYPPESVHSVVIVTKFPEAVLVAPVRSVLGRYDQVVVQATITGLGGTALEPRVPPPEAALATLPALIEFTGRPERVIVRVDPIVHWRTGDTTFVDGLVRTNLPSFGEIAGRARQAGVTVVKTSLASPYRKAIRRFEQAGLRLIDPRGDERERVLRELEREATRAGVALEFCCEEARPRRACVDARRLTQLHPRGLPACPERAAGQRNHCGCSRSVDLAWYASHPCPSGCLYCYANPVAEPSPDGGRRDP
jgi:DNA repair photolyase